MLSFHTVSRERANDEDESSLDGSAICDICGIYGECCFTADKSLLVSYSINAALILCAAFKVIVKLHNCLCQAAYNSEAFSKMPT